MLRSQIPGLLHTEHFFISGCLDLDDVFDTLDRDWFLLRNEQLICDMEGIKFFCDSDSSRFTSDPSGGFCTSKMSSLLLHV